MDWRKMSGVLCDKNYNKNKHYKTIVKPDNKINEHRMNVVQMKILRQMCEITKDDGNIRSAEIALIVGKMRENMLIWIRHVMMINNLEEK